ncbi:MAG: hypothetical protein WKG07_05140 [Hymenobacter sp.]
MLLTTGLALAATALPLLAHDAWVDPFGGPVYQVFYGHKPPKPTRWPRFRSYRCLTRSSTS